MYDHSIASEVHKYLRAVPGYPAKHVSTHSTYLSGSFRAAEFGMLCPISIEGGARITALQPRTSQLSVCFLFVPDPREPSLRHLLIVFPKYDTAAPADAAITGWARTVYKTTHIHMCCCKLIALPGSAYQQNRMQERRRLRNVPPFCCVRV